VRIIGSAYHQVYFQTKRTWLIEFDADYWKRRLHEGLVSALILSDGSDQSGTGDALSLDRPGAVTLYSDTPMNHARIVKHWIAEVEVEEPHPMLGVKRYWKQVNKANHLLDATSLAMLACEYQRERAEMESRVGAGAGAGGSWYERQVKK
jgi:hypothetical protein